MKMVPKIIKVVPFGLRKRWGYALNLYPLEDRVRMLDPEWVNLR